MYKLFWVLLGILILGGVYYWNQRADLGNPENATSLDQGDNALPVSPDLTWDQLVARHPNELADPVNRTVYSCADGKSFLARVEIKPAGGGKAEVFLKDGTKMLLNQTMSGSGVRYANSGESFIFWTKGDTAFIDEGPVRSYADCAAQK
jgi:membrane-bound inhibitor of C-type lysozyme